MVYVYEVYVSSIHMKSGSSEPAERFSRVYHSYEIQKFQGGKKKKWEQPKKNQKKKALMKTTNRKNFKKSNK